MKPASLSHGDFLAGEVRPCQYSNRHHGLLATTETTRSVRRPLSNDNSDDDSNDNLIAISVFIEEIYLSRKRPCSWNLRMTEEIPVGKNINKRFFFFFLSVF